jgi:acyl carrier protein
MNEDTLTNQIRLFIARQLGLNFQDIDVEAHFNDDLGLDDLDVIELTILIEEQFAQGNVINDNDQIEFVRDLICHIENSDHALTSGAWGEDTSLRKVRSSRSTNRSRLANS